MFFLLAAVQYTEQNIPTIPLHTVLPYHRPEFTSKYYGVHLCDNRRRYSTCVYYQGKSTYLGDYDTEELAAAARDCFILEKGLEKQGYKLNHVSVPMGYEWKEKERRLKRV